MLSQGRKAEAAYLHKQMSKEREQNQLIAGDKRSSGTELQYHYSMQVCQLIKDLLQVNDKRRITAAQVLEKYHGWF